MLSPAHTLLNTGIAHHRAGRLDEALAAYRDALKLAPEDLNALNAAGTLMLDLGKPAEALMYYNEAVKRHPREVMSYRNMARLFIAGADYAKAEICLRQALKLTPQDHSLTRLLAQIQAKQDKTEAARQALDGIAGDTADKSVLALERLNTAPAIWPDNDAIDAWRNEALHTVNALKPIDIARRLPELYDSAIGIDFRILCHGRDNRPFREAYSSRFICSATPRFQSNEGEARRVGFYISAFYENVFLRVLGRMLARWEDDGVQPVVLCHPAGLEKCHLAINNPRIEYAVVPEQLQGIAEAAWAARLDMCYLWEVGSNTPNYLLPMLRLAPLQCTSWGSVETTGLNAVDYFLSSRPQEGANAQSYYTEELHLLEHLPTVFPRMPDAMYRKRTRADFGLEETARIYLLPHHAWKLHPDMDAAVAEVLMRDPGGIACYVEGVMAAHTARLKERVARHIPAQMHERVRFVPYQQYEGYLSLMALSDVILDTLHYSGGQTTLDALACGTPVVTLPGFAMRGRSTLACYKTMGFGEAELAAYTLEDYAAKAVAAAQRPELRGKLLERCGTLFDNPATIADHARFFREAVDRYRDAV